MSDGIQLDVFVPGTPSDKERIAKLESLVAGLERHIVRLEREIECNQAHIKVLHEKVDECGDCCNGKNETEELPEGPQDDAA